MLQEGARPGVFRNRGIERTQVEWERVYSEGTKEQSPKLEDEKKGARPRLENGVSGQRGLGGGLGVLRSILPGNHRRVSFSCLVLLLITDAGLML